MTRARVVWAVPQSVHDECPLPEPWYWQDEDTDVFAALKHPDEGPFAWFWRASKTATEMSFFRKTKKNKRCGTSTLNSCLTDLQHDK